MAERIVSRVEFFKEGDLYVGLALELNVSSFGETLDEARQSLGTFEEVMEESGFTKRGDS